ncbi:MAG TPA: IS21 family transposase [Pseudonocardiaceae bacterium]
MVDMTEILVHWDAGRSQSEIATSLGLDRKTVKKYLTPAIEAGLEPGSGRSQAEWAEPVRGWFPWLADTAVRQVTWPAIAVHRDYIVEQLEAGVTKATIWQRLRDEKDLQASVASLKRWIAANLPERSLRSRVTVLGDDPPPGQDAQIDYGYLGSWIDPIGGRRRRVWAFVMVLACSRHLFLRPVLRMDQLAWTECHVEGFRFFGGCPARLVPDNLKTGVVKADLYDPQLNRSYAELAAHYDVLIDPARARKPRDKPRVERPVPYCRDSFWRGREFGSLEQMQHAALDWSANVAGRRACRPLDGAAPLTVFEAVEAETLKPLPRTVFVLAAWSRPAVAPDIHVRVGKTLYSAPWRFIGQRVDARATATTVQLFCRGELIATHAAAPRGKVTDYSHYPPEKIAFKMRTPAWCRTRAGEVGPNTVAVIADLLAVNALFRLRAAQGVLGLVDKHGPGRLEAACGKALAVGDPSYRTIKGILAAGAEADPAPAATGDGGAAAHLHGPERLFVVPLPTTTNTAQDTPSTDDLSDRGADDEATNNGDQEVSA